MNSAFNRAVFLPDSTSSNEATTIDEYISMNTCLKAGTGRNSKSENLAFFTGLSTASLNYTT